MSHACFPRLSLPAPGSGLGQGLCGDTYLTRPLAISIVWVRQGLGAHEQGPPPPTRCALSLVPEIDLGLCWAMPSSSRAAQAGGGQDLGPASEQLPAATAPHRALTAPRTPSPHPLGPAALGGLQSPGGFLTGACPSTPPGSCSLRQRMRSGWGTCPAHRGHRACLLLLQQSWLLRNPHPAKGALICESPSPWRSRHG